MGTDRGRVNVTVEGPFSLPPAFLPSFNSFDTFNGHNCKRTDTQKFLKWLETVLKVAFAPLVTIMAYILCKQLFRSEKNFLSLCCIEMRTAVKWPRLEQFEAIPAEKPEAWERIPRKCHLTSPVPNNLSSPS